MWTGATHPPAPPPALACVELRYSSTRRPPNTRPTAWSSVQTGASSIAATMSSTGCAASAAAAAVGACPSAAAAAAAAAGTAAGGAQAARRRQRRCEPAGCEHRCAMNDAESAGGEPARLWESACGAAATHDAASVVRVILLACRVQLPADGIIVAIEHMLCCCAPLRAVWAQSPASQHQICAPTSRSQPCHPAQQPRGAACCCQRKVKSSPAPPSCWSCSRPRPTTRWSRQGHDLVSVAPAIGSTGSGGPAACIRRQP